MKEEKLFSCVVVKKSKIVRKLEKFLLCLIYPLFITGSVLIILGISTSSTSISLVTVCGGSLIVLSLVVTFIVTYRDSD